MSHGIDTAFVRKWAPIYDQPDVGDDEPRYLQIIRACADEMSRNGVLEEKTFREIIDWKAARLLGKKGWIGRHLEGGLYKRLYAPRIREAVRASNEESIFKLRAPGIDAPVASTVLHMILPNKFPIMDVRTVDVLNQIGYIWWKTRSRENYQDFTKTMWNLRRKTGQSLREIDRALFAYHKRVLEPKAMSSKGKLRRTDTKVLSRSLACLLCSVRIFGMPRSLCQ